mgnify:CR=1 FL=1
MMKKSSDYFWLWMPIVFCLLLSSGYFIVNALTDSHKDNPGAVIYALLFVVFYGLRHRSCQSCIAKKYATWAGENTFAAFIMPR